MSFENERLAIENRFNENWTDTPVAWGNVDADVNNNEDWVRFNILNGDSGFRTIGGTKRHIGIINVQIFVPKDSGTSISRRYADTIANIFDNKSFNDVVCNVASMTTIGADDVWHQTNVNIPYWRDE